MYLPEPQKVLSKLVLFTFLFTLLPCSPNGEQRKGHLSLAAVARAAVWLHEPVWPSQGSFSLTLNTHGIPFLKPPQNSSQLPQHLLRKPGPRERRVTRLYVSRPRPHRCLLPPPRSGSARPPL